VDGMQKREDEGVKREERGKCGGCVCVFVTVGAGPERQSARTNTLAGTRLGGKSRSAPPVSSVL
jgi:hypothetical protein